MLIIWFQEKHPNNVNLDSYTFPRLNVSKWPNSRKTGGGIKKSLNPQLDKLSKEHISKQHHLAWKTIKDLSGKNSGSSVRIKGGSAKKRLENWSNHFENLLGKSAKVPENCTLPNVPVSDTLPIETSSFTISELKAATKNLKSSKAFGPDNIPAVIWKDENFHELLLNLCNYTLSTFKSPKIWHQSQIIPCLKKEIYP